MRVPRFKESIAAAGLCAAASLEGPFNVVIVCVTVIAVIRFAGLFCDFDDVGVDSELSNRIVAMGASVGVKVRAVRVSNICCDAAWFPKRWRREGILELSEATARKGRHHLDAVIWHELGHGRQHVRGIHSIHLAARLTAVIAAATVIDNTAAAAGAAVIAVAAVDLAALAQSRRAEHAADRFAATRLGRRDVLDGLTHSNDSWWQQLWSSHPTAQQRHRHLARRLGHLPNPEIRTPRPVSSRQRRRTPDVSGVSAAH